MAELDFATSALTRLFHVKGSVPCALESGKAAASDNLVWQVKAGQEDTD